MFISPLFELIAAMAILASALSPMVNDAIAQRQQGVVAQVASEIGAAVGYVSQYCSQNNNSCTGVSWANLQAAKLISPTLATEYTNDLLLGVATDLNGGTDSFLIRTANNFDPTLLDGYRDESGTVPAIGTDTGNKLCYRPDNGGVYRMTTAGDGC